MLLSVNYSNNWSIKTSPVRAGWCMADKFLTWAFRVCCYCVCYNNNNNTLIYIAPACRMTSEALLLCAWQYFSPYLSADMRKMAEAFNTTVSALEEELMQLILDGKISARIDSHNKAWIHTLSSSVFNFLFFFWSCLVWVTMASQQSPRGKSLQHTGEGFVTGHIK